MVMFEGDAIGIYGTVNNDHGLFSVSIDDGTATNLNGTSPNVHFQTLLVRERLVTPHIILMPQNNSTTPAVYPAEHTLLS